MSEQPDTDDLQARLTYATRAWEHWQDRAEAAEAAVRRVRELHAAKPCGCCCTHCDGGWPCPDIAALDGAP